MFSSFRRAVRVIPVSKRACSTFFPKAIDKDAVSATIQLPLKFIGDIPRTVDIVALNVGDTRDSTEVQTIISDISAGNYKAVLIDVTEDEIASHITNGSPGSWLISHSGDIIVGIVETARRTGTELYFIGPQHQGIFNHATSALKTSQKEKIDAAFELSPPPVGLSRSAILSGLADHFPKSLLSRITEERAVGLAISAEGVLGAAGDRTGFLSRPGTRVLLVPHPLAAPWTVDLLSRSSQNAQRAGEGKRGIAFGLDISDKDKKEIFAPARKVISPHSQAMFLVSSVLAASLLSLAAYTVVQSTVLSNTVKEVQDRRAIEIDLKHGQEKAAEAKIKAPKSVF